MASHPQETYLASPQGRYLKRRSLLGLCPAAPPRGGLAPPGYFLEENALVSLSAVMQTGRTVQPGTAMTVKKMGPVHATGSFFSAHQTSPPRAHRHLVPAIPINLEVSDTLSEKVILSPKLDHLLANVDINVDDTPFINAVTLAL